MLRLRPRRLAPVFLPVPGHYELRFWGRTGRTYFLLQNDDLAKPWTYFHENPAPAL